MWPTSYLIQCTNEMCLTQQRAGSLGTKPICWAHSLFALAEGPAPSCSYRFPPDLSLVGWSQLYRGGFLMHRQTEELYRSRFKKSHVRHVHKPLDHNDFVHILSLFGNGEYIDLATCKSYSNYVVFWWVRKKQQAYHIDSSGALLKNQWM